MKKILLTILVSATVAGAYAQEPKEPKFFANHFISKISANGKWVASDANSTVILINLETGENTVFTGDGGTTDYSVGSGNCVSDNGILLLSSDYSGTVAQYYDGTDIKNLSIGDGIRANNFANGITPDGSSICGSIGLHAMSLDGDALMCVPAVWKRGADGSYGEPILLPHPDTDLVGRVPQYVTASRISDDGTTVIGQIIDGAGAYVYPILYNEDADGTWSYTLPTVSLFNPEQIAIPEYPGECPDNPDPETYLTAEEKEAYDEALQAYYDSNYTDPYPEYTSFMSAEALARYQADLAAYETSFMEWSPKFDAFLEAYYGAVTSSPGFAQNQIALVPDGSGFALTQSSEDSSDPWAWPPVTIDHIWYFDTATNEITKYEEKNLSISDYAAGYLLAVETDSDSGCYNGYLLKDGQYISLHDFLCAKGETIKEWVELNMTHETEIFDWETETTVTKTLVATGMPVASRDLRVLASTTPTVWGDYEPESYVFDFGTGSAISEVLTDRHGAELDAEGNLLVGADVASVAVYDVAGRCVLNVATPAASVDCGNIAEGVYVVNVTYTDGTTATTKVAK